MVSEQETENSLKRSAAEDAQAPESKKAKEDLGEEKVSDQPQDISDAVKEAKERNGESDKTEESKKEEETVTSKPEEAKEKPKNKGKGLKGRISKKYDEPEENEDEEDEDEEGDENDENDNEEEEEDLLEEIDTTNIIHGRRTRGKVIDYEKTLKEMEKEKGSASINDDEDDEDEDADFKAPEEVK